VGAGKGRGSGHGQAGAPREGRRRTCVWLGGIRAGEPSRDSPAVPRGALGQTLMRLPGVKRQPCPQSGWCQCFSAVRTAKRRPPWHRVPSAWPLVGPAVPARCPAAAGVPGTRRQDATPAGPCGQRGRRRDLGQSRGADAPGSSPFFPVKSVSGRGASPGSDVPRDQVRRHEGLVQP
jgi:hypothetical protein